MKLSPLFAVAQASILQFDYEQAYDSQVQRAKRTTDEDETNDSNSYRKVFFVALSFCLFEQRYSMAST